MEVPSERGWIVLTARWAEGGGAAGRASLCNSHQLRPHTEPEGE